MIPKIPLRLKGLLVQCLDSRPDSVTLVTGPKDVTLSSKQRFKIRDLIGDELCRSGLNNNGEPNKRGLALEELIDSIGTPD